MRQERSVLRSLRPVRRYGFVVFAIALAMSVIGLPGAAQAASSNQLQVTAMTYNLFQGSELTDGAPRGAVVPDGGERPSISPPS